MDLETTEVTEYEAYELAAQYIQLAHEIGESNHVRIQFWVGVSFTLLGLTYLVPDRLTLVSFSSIVIVSCASPDPDKRLVDIQLSLLITVQSILLETITDLLSPSPPI